MKTLYKSEQSGRSMVEMLGVLAIIGVLSVGGIAGYSKAMAKFKTSKALDQVSTTVAPLFLMKNLQESLLSRERHLRKRSSSRLRLRLHSTTSLTR